MWSRPRWATAGGWRQWIYGNSLVLVAGVGIGLGPFPDFVRSLDLVACRGAVIRVEIQDESAADGSLLAMDSVELVVK